MAGFEELAIPPIPAFRGGPDALSIGEALVALIATDGLPIRSAVQFRRTVVGAEFNVAVGLARLGHRAVFAGRVGDDPFGQVIEDVGRANGVECQLTRDCAASTGVLLRDVQAARPITVQYARGGSAGSRLCIQDLNSNSITATRALHISGITAVLSPQSSEAVGWAMATARSSGALVSFDPNVRWRLMHREHSRPVMRALLADTSLLQAGVEELCWLANEDDIERAQRWAFDQGPSLVVVKDGSRGAWASDGRETMRVSAIPTTLVDSVGAGDAFAAGLLSGLLNGKTVEQSLHRAATVAAFVVATPGEIEGLPDAKQCDAFADYDGEVHR